MLDEISFDEEAMSSFVIEDSPTAREMIPTVIFEQPGSVSLG